MTAAAAATTTVATTTTATAATTAAAVTAAATATTAATTTTTTTAAAATTATITAATVATTAATTTTTAAITITTATTATTTAAATTTTTTAATTAPPSPPPVSHGTTLSLTQARVTVNHCLNSTDSFLPQCLERVTKSTSPQFWALTEGTRLMAPLSSSLGVGMGASSTRLPPFPSLHVTYSWRKYPFLLFTGMEMKAEPH